MLLLSALSLLQKKWCMFVVPYFETFNSLKDERGETGKHHVRVIYMREVAEGARVGGVSSIMVGGRPLKIFGEGTLTKIRIPRRRTSQGRQEPSELPPLCLKNVVNCSTTNTNKIYSLR